MTDELNTGIKQSSGRNEGGGGGGGQSATGAEDHSVQCDTSDKVCRRNRFHAVDSASRAVSNWTVYWNTLKPHFIKPPQ